VAFWDKLPELAVIVTVEVPDGVVVTGGGVGLLPPPHPEIE
jgi:hydroxymethylglutaryl-CoA reductase